MLIPHGVSPDAGLEIQNELWDEYEDRIGNNPGEEPDGAAILEGVLLARGLPHDRAFAEELWQRTHLGPKFFGAQLFEDAVPILEWARDSGLGLAILSNRAYGDELLQADLEVLGIAGFFDAAVASGGVGARKPCPEPFLKVLRLLDVAPGEVVMVGDVVEADVAGGRAVGMITAWVDRKGRSQEGWDRLYPGVDVTPHYTVQTLNELIGLPIW